MRQFQALLFVALIPAFAAAQSHKPAAATAPHRTSTEPPAASTLPVTRVALYKNGVGFFEHSGQVTGSQSVTIDFTTAQLNDVLQSLTAIDLNGGRIAGAGYNSTTPLDQQLKALALALPDKATFSTLFNKLRGTRVEITGSGTPFTGRLVDEEMHKTGPGKDQAGMTEGRFLTVASDSGEVRIFQLTPSLTVRLLDTAAHTDLTQYLQVLDSNRNQGLRHLTLQDIAPDAARTPRELHVSYISEVPVWKSTYRILITTPKATPAPASQTVTLQGWSVVDNTTGSDWNNVHLSLIAGAPQSFIQPISQPIYSRRPEIPIAQEAQLTPQTHESGDLTLQPAAAPKMAGAAGMAGRGAGVMGGIGSGSGSGIGTGSGGNMGGGVFRAEDNASSTVLNGRALDSLSSYQEQAFNSLAPNTTTAAFDDYFAYNLADPITIRKNESALVPILQTKVDAERVTLWSPQQPVPLRALWITNTSALTLDRGSFSIVEDGNFGGEGLLDPIHPNEKRLLSYAVDQAVRVTTESNLNSSHVTSITAAKGVLALHRTQITEIVYVVHNAAPEARMVIIEHPIHQGYTLDSDPRPAETTPTLYRYRVLTDPGATIRLHVGERRPTTTNYQLTRSDDNQFNLILNETGHNPALEAALQPILAARRRVADAQQALDKINVRLTDLRSDEERQRSNITALATADKASRDRFVHDLNTTEDQIASTQKDLAAAQTALQAAKDDLAGRIESFQMDEKL